MVHINTEQFKQHLKTFQFVTDHWHFRAILILILKTLGYSIFYSICRPLLFWFSCMWRYINVCVYFLLFIMTMMKGTEKKKAQRNTGIKYQNTNNRQLLGAVKSIRSIYGNWHSVALRWGSQEELYRPFAFFAFLSYSAVAVSLRYSRWNAHLSVPLAWVRTTLDHTGKDLWDCTCIALATHHCKRQLRKPLAPTIYSWHWTDHSGGYWQAELRTELVQAEQW